MQPEQFAGLLIQTAIVYRRPRGPQGEARKDRFGQPIEPGPGRTDEHVRLPCRISRASGGEQFGERMQDVVQVTNKLFLDAGADLRETDEVTVFLTGDPDETPIVERAAVLLVDPVMDGVGEHHREAKLSAQRSST